MQKMKSRWILGMMVVLMATFGLAALEAPQADAAKVRCRNERVCKYKTRPVCRKVPVTTCRRNRKGRKVCTTVRKTRCKNKSYKSCKIKRVCRRR